MAPLMCEDPGPRQDCPYKAKGNNMQVGWGDFSLCSGFLPLAFHVELLTHLKSVIIWMRKSAVCSIDGELKSTLLD